MWLVSFWQSWRPVTRGKEQASTAMRGPPRTTTIAHLFAVIDSAFWDGSTWLLTPSPALRQERLRASRSVRGVGSVPPGHVSIRSRPCVRWPDPAAAILGILAAASFVTPPRGTAWQGACGRGWASPLPLGSSAGAQAAGVAELSGSGVARPPRSRARRGDF